MSTTSENVRWGGSDTGRRGVRSAAAVASIGAGAVHATVVGGHAAHAELTRLMVMTAALQLAAGVWMLLGGRRWAAAAVVLVNVAAVGGWQVTRMVAVPWIDGLATSEAPQLTDTLCAVLGAIAIVGVLIAEFVGWPSAGRVAGVLPVVVVVPVAALAMWTGATRSHAHGDDAHGHEEAGVAAVVPPTPYDPALPIDLGGVDGVSPEQQAAAENLVAITVLRLPQWSDPSDAEAAGFHSIGDALTGHEHFINWEWIEDDVWLDPDRPESLVYEPQPDGSRKLVSAMFMLPASIPLTEVPDIGGALMQWHIHEDLCFTDDPVAPRVARVTSSGGPCPAGTVAFPPSAMIHVWITPHPCGPFAALEGVGAGQIAAGEERLCDHAHGSS